MTTHPPPTGLLYGGLQVGFSTRDVEFDFSNSPTRCQTSRCQTSTLGFISGPLMAGVRCTDRSMGWGSHGPAALSLLPQVGVGERMFEVPVELYTSLREKLEEDSSSKFARVS